MPSLVLLRSPPMQLPPPEEVALSADPQVIGRIPAECQIVLKHESVSKHHARIFADRGTYYIEDLKSRNKTYINGHRLPPHKPKPLMPDDEIRICDFLLQYCAEEDRIAVEVTQEFLVAPADRLKALLALSSGAPGAPDLRPLLDQVADTLFSTNQSRALELGPLVNQVADTLLGLFRSAERCFVLLHDEYGRPHPRATRCRRGNPDDARHCRSLVKKAVETMRSHLAVDTPSSTGAEPRSVMCVPLATSEGRALGAIQIETRDRSEKFAAADLGLLTIVANLAGVAIDRALLHAKARETAVVQKEIELAREVQLGFLPQKKPKVDGYDFYCHYSPATTVGGDFYDFVPLPGGRVAVVLGDVAGHGVPAALLVAKLSSEVRFCLLSEPDPAKAVCLLNEHMRSALRDRFVTLVLMVLDPAAHLLTVVNAGHTIPKLYSAGKRKLADLVPAEASGVPLGVAPEWEYLAVTAPLEAGDTVIVYTDGVTDAMNPAGVMFGAEALEQSLTPSDSQGSDAARPRRVGEALLTAVRNHANGRPQTDDIAILCFGRWDASADSNSTLNGQAAGGTRDGSESAPP